MSSLTPQPLWRSLETALDDPEQRARLSMEFPTLGEVMSLPLDRRRALKLVAAALLSRSLGGCDSKFAEDLIPAVRIPPNIIPSRPNEYATAHVLDGYATGVVVTHQMGRPIGIAGNPEHPASLGAIDPFSQAQLLELYDPDRGGDLQESAGPATRSQLLQALAEQRELLQASQGAGLRILTGSTSSPTLIGELQALLAQFPAARWVVYDPIGREAPRLATRELYGRPLDTVPQLDAVEVLLALEGDLFGGSPGWLAQAHAFGARRNPTRTARPLRLYALESTPTLMGSVADHRIALEPGQLAEILERLQSRLLGQGPARADDPAWLGPLVADLSSAGAHALVHVGAALPAALHAHALRINEGLKARGVSYRLLESATTTPLATDSLDSLVTDMRAGRVQMLLMLDSNPCLTAPGPLGFSEALGRVPFSLAHTGYFDETARATRWWVPRRHDWEGWGDARAFDGSASIVQPQTLPLFGGWSPFELLAAVRNAPPMTDEARVQARWRDQWPGEFNAGWQAALARGVITGTASTASGLALRSAGSSTAAAASPATTSASSAAPAPAAATSTSMTAATLPPGPGPATREPHAPGRPIELLLRADPALWDGRYANNPWLQELPRPLTKVVWDNPLLISPALARELALENGTHVVLNVEGLELQAPVWILPGQAAHCVTAHLGSGRSAAGSVGNDQGFNFYPLLGRAGTVRLRRGEGRAALASTEHHQLLLEAPQEILRHTTLAALRAAPAAPAMTERGQPPEPAEPSPQLYRTIPPGPAAWGMSIDLNACIGCNACVIACQAENNVAVVGRDQVRREREMHWLRIDRYYAGSPDAPDTFFQPVLCMHCEQAPCENVCPVGATVHDAEGLNVMVYNRCIGTRFCSNNCPYKVRRFNFYGYGREQHRPPESWNPDVTVRARGVMEKCTYCIQRIAQARIEADRESRPVGEVHTACEAACPTRAFTFGNLADPASAVVARKRSTLTYAMLESQNTQPRTTYESLVRNPNPDMPA